MTVQACMHASRKPAPSVPQHRLLFTRADTDYVMYYTITRGRNSCIFYVQAGSL